MADYWSVGVGPCFAFCVTWANISRFYSNSNTTQTRALFCGSRPRAAKWRFKMHFHLLHSPPFLTLFAKTCWHTHRQANEQTDMKINSAHQTTIGWLCIRKAHLLAHRLPSFVEKLKRVACRRFLFDSWNGIGVYRQSASVVRCAYACLPALTADEVDEACGEWLSGACGACAPWI